MPSTDIIALPKNYTAYMFGAATAGWKQEVKVKVQNTDGDDEIECTFEAAGGAPLVVTGGGAGFMNQEAVVIQADKTTDRQIEFNFKVFKNGVTSSDKDFKKDTHNPVTWVTNYTYTAEDGGDNDYHDTTFVVSLIKDAK